MQAVNLKTNFISILLDQYSDFNIVQRISKSSFYFLPIGNTDVMWPTTSAVVLSVVRCNEIKSPGINYFKAAISNLYSYATGRITSSEQFCCLLCENLACWQLSFDICVSLASVVCISSTTWPPHLYFQIALQHSSTVAATFDSLLHPKKENLVVNN